MKSGVGLETKLTVQGIADVQRMWSLSSGDIQNCDDLLLVSTSNQTLLLAITDNGTNVVQVTGESFGGLRQDRPTLAAGQLPQGRGFVQVTSSEVVLIGVEASATYSSTTEIVAAAADANSLIIGERSGSVKLLTLPGLEVTA